MPARPVADAPVAALTAAPDALARDWLVALLARVPLAGAAAVPVADLAREAPALCARWSARWPPSSSWSGCRRAICTRWPHAPARWRGPATPPRSWRPSSSCGACCGPRRWPSCAGPRRRSSPIWPIAWPRSPRWSAPHRCARRLRRRRRPRLLRAAGRAAAGRLRRAAVGPDRRRAQRPAGRRRATSCRCGTCARASWTAARWSTSPSASPTTSPTSRTLGVLLVELDGVERLIAAGDDAVAAAQAAEHALEGLLRQGDGARRDGPGPRLDHAARHRPGRRPRAGAAHRGRRRAGRRASRRAADRLQRDRRVPQRRARRRGTWSTTPRRRCSARGRAACADAGAAAT